jgi:hypothetical protein
MAPENVPNIADRLHSLLDGGIAFDIIGQIHSLVDEIIAILKLIFDLPFRLLGEILIVLMAELIFKFFKYYWVGTPSIFEAFWTELSTKEDKWLVDHVPRFLIHLMKIAEISKFCLGLLIESAKFAIESITNMPRP